MQNMTEYVKWRGDIPFKAFPICDADYLVFAQLAYLPYGGIVGDSFEARMTLGQAAQRVLEKIEAGGGKYVISLAENVLLAREIVRSPRFSQLPIGGYVDIFNEKKQEQFSAVTFLIPDHEDPGNSACVVAYRGTDSTLVGWKEDFNMAFSRAIPAQLDAVRYLEKVHRAYPLQRLFVCGHSKGGNLAMYACAFCDSDTSDAVAAVRNLDGPGFPEEILMKEGFRKMLSRSETVVPSSSLVGILFEHTEAFTVIRSYSNSMPFQHNPFTWEIERSGYVELEHITENSTYIDDTITKWLASMPFDMREKLVNGIFAVVDATGVDDIRKLFTRKNLMTVLRELKNLDPETRQVITEAIALFKKASDNNLPKFIDKLVRSVQDAGKTPSRKHDIARIKLNT